MDNNINYRIPALEEFVPGFEYEWNDSTYQSGILDLSTGTIEQLGEPMKHWTAKTFGADKFFTLQVIEEKLTENKIRVKIT